MMPHRDPGTQLPLLINPQDPAAEIDVQETKTLLQAFVKGLKQWDGTDGPPAPGDDNAQDIRELMAESVARYAELGICVEYRTS